MAAPSPSINHDRPLHGVDVLSQDKLARRGFAESAISALRHVTDQSGLVLSVEGEWGSGKTSALAMIEALLADQDKFPRPPVLVHFNPWLVGDRDALLRQFLAAIAARLDVLDNAGVAQQVAKELRAYGKVFDVIKLIPGAEPWVTLVKSAGEVIGAVGDATASISDYKAPDLETRRNKLADALRSFERPIIVFIDDIDRLFPGEVFEMVRIVKAVGDLPNVGYVLAWDASYVSDALRAANVPQASSYLDKIVQVRLSLPKLSSAATLHLVDEALNKLDPEALKCHSKDEEERLSSLYHAGLKHVLEQPRDVLRVFNTVSLLEPGLRGEIAFADIVGLATLMVKAPEVYKLMVASPHFFVGRLPGDVAGLVPGDFVRGAKSEDMVAAVSAERERAVHQCGKPEAIRRLLHALFPLVAQAEGGRSLGSVEAAHGHIASPDRLLVALQQSTSPMDVSMVSARRYLCEPQARESIAKTLTADNCLDFLGSLEDVVRSTSGLGIDDPEALCVCIARLIETGPFVQVSKRRMNFFSSNCQTPAKAVIQSIIDAKQVVASDTVWTQIARDGIALALAVEVIADRRNRDANTQLYHGADHAQPGLPDDIDVFARNVLVAAQDNRLLNGLQPGYLLRRLAEFKPVACKAVFDAIHVSDPKLDNFVLEFFDHSFDSVKGQTFSLPDQSERVEAYVSLNQLRIWGTERLSDQEMTYPLKAAWRAVVEGKKLYAVDGSESRR